VACGKKERVLGGKEGKTKMRRRGGIVSLKIDLTLLFIPGYLQLII